MNGLKNIFCLVLFSIGKCVFAVTPTMENAIALGASGNLPVVFINTADGRPIVDRVNWRTMTFTMLDPNNPQNNIQTLANQQIRGRGNWTWYHFFSLGNPPYRIRFRNGQEQSLFGLPMARNWVLLVGYRGGGDAVGFELGRRLGLECSPTTNFVELVFNGEFKGLRQLSEHRQADPFDIGAPGRPKICQESGWLVQIDRIFNTSADRGDPGFRTTHYNLPVLIKRSDLDQQILDQQFSNNGVIPNSINISVRNDWNELTALMYSENFPENEWRDLIYMDAWVRYFMTQTIVRHRYLSNYWAFGGVIADLYVHKDRYGKISAGPLWDLDNSLVWMEDEQTPSNHTIQGVYTARREPWLPRNVDWLARFFEDPIFIARYKEIWNENIGDISTMPNFLDSIATLVSADFSDRVQFLEQRIQFLDSAYNAVTPMVTNRDFGVVTFGTYQDINAQIFNFISYQDIENLSLTLQNGVNSAFEIIASECFATSMKRDIHANTRRTSGNGRITTVSVRPRNTLQVGSHRDNLVLTGTNQGNAVSIHVPLTVLVLNPLQAWSQDGRLYVTGLAKDEMLYVFSLTGRLVHRHIATSETVGLSLPATGLYIVRANNETLKVFFAK